MAYYDLAAFIYARNHFFSGLANIDFGAISAWLIAEGQHMLPKRSTSVDQIFESDRAMSQLSVDIFIASRNQF